MKEGVLPDKEIVELMGNKSIIFSEKMSESQIQPSSLDLRCGFGKRVWHMPFSSIPGGDLERYLNENSTHSFLLDERRFLHKGSVYVLELDETLNLPMEISARSNPKSTTGRWDIHVRTLTENGTSFDEIREGYKGKLFLELISNSFDLDIPPNYSLNQIRFFRGKLQKLNNGMLEYLARANSLLKNQEGTTTLAEKFIKDDSINLTLALEKEDPGYVARHDAPGIDLSSPAKSLQRPRYFDRVNLNNGKLVLAPMSFYLLKTREGIIIPSDHCAEMVDIATGRGEFRAHYAGFFDPGFGGNDAEGNFGASATLEVRNTSKIPILLEDGQTISSLQVYQLTGAPGKTYGIESGSNYQGQRKVKGPKHINMEE